MNYLEHLVTYGYLDPKLIHNPGSVKRALQLYQSFFMDDLVEVQSTLYTENGDIGPGLLSHMELPRCGCPDFLEGVPLGGSGSWPQGCHGSGNFHRARLYFEMSQLPSHWQPVFNSAYDLMAACYRDMGIDLERVPIKSQANITITWERSSSWIGLAIVGRNQTCKTQIWAKFDNRYGSSLTGDQRTNQLAMLMAHEFGHNMGMSHSSGGIMNPTLSRFKLTPTSWRDDPYRNTMIRWFGGVPYNTTPPTTTTTTTPPPISPPPQENLLQHGWVMTSDGAVLTGFGSKSTTLIVEGKSYKGVSL